ncbi:MAG: phenylalanine--tRNA ligase subunit alpha [Candidatus Bipolaricaulota bacterium]|nr:phenylalanine--tRNA ligase subunit alpha [Candidatus Bipolaricaulota bacterium]MCS7274975.1 phenylalanine--tRNA ligase subunit alpha [Candidatus Bipolaricaulota bacterium]MDW8110350.1 phenylalanine--tRNA ligase subunit alpha [Candidatus Bipolaricaulota bacterium]MDW8328754.1 phenylalanine--tRNA ligase subunit alpha [Candidatus Bipolaricaulota bacterium]
MATAQHDGLIQKARKLEEQALQELQALSSTRHCEEFRVKYLGRKGQLAQLLDGLQALAPDQRAEAGRLLNALKEMLTAKLEQRLAEFAHIEKEARLRAEALDVTLPGRRQKLGSLHLITQVTKELEDIFVRLGFEVVSGPEIETDYYNFEALNIPKDHPARDDWDSFYLDGFDDLLLRTHTSPVQIRVMQQRRPPVKVVCSGKCFRRDATDATHSPVFHQIEMLWVDKGINFAHLKGTILAFLEEFYGKGFEARFVGDYFPFTEPSIQVHVRRKGTEKWLEILGAGMVDPAVLQEVDYDPEEYTGFAFGLGVERMAMLKYGVDDIRTFYQNDMRFLEAF